MKKIVIFSLNLGLLFLVTLLCKSWAQQTLAKGTAVIQGTQAGSPITGTANFEETAEGLKMDVQVFNVPPGKHGFHIHELGSCDDEGKAAGGHFNPAGVKHGFLPQDGHLNAHAGDAGNILIDENGEGALSLTLPDVGLINGKHNVEGKTVILHEKEDDFGQPTGKAGGRIACGIIQLTEGK